MESGSSTDDSFDLEGTSSPPEPLSPERARLSDEILSRHLEPDERGRLERLLIQRLKESRAKITEMLEHMSNHWGYEDAFYRFYHGSFKVYGVQQTTERGVNPLKSLLPERQLNLPFEAINKDGTGKEFELEHNKEWSRHTRPILEAFSHARFMIEMARRYSELDEPPHPLPSGWAALLYHSTDKGYILYSAGPDGQDDGRREPPRNRRSGAKSYDITFVVER